MANTERMTQLRRVAEAVPEENLHMRAWCEKAECGTAYCLAGWAAIDPWFQRQTEITKIFRVSDDGYVSNLVDNPCDHLARLFAIDNDDAVHLFGGDLNCTAGAHAVTKAEVLWNIDALLNGNDAMPYQATGNDVPVFAGAIENPHYVKHVDWV